MHTEPTLDQIQTEWHGSLKDYAIGFILSLVLTFISFALVTTLSLTGATLVYALISLALIQAIVQLKYFLHLGKEADLRWERLIFFFMILVLLIVCLGSLWVMHDLNDRVMSGMLEGMAHD